jgi:hypothetical protein
MTSRQNEYNRRRRARLAEAGVCRDCGRPSGGAYRCDACATYHRLTQRLARDERAAHGRCIYCGARRVRGKTMCASCLEHHRLSVIRATDDRRVAGLCTQCGRKTTPGYVTCRSCRQYSTASMRERRRT